MPKRTLKLMEQLGLNGKDPEHQRFFQRLHHFGDGAAIGSHMSYCGKRDSFQHSSPNHVVRERLAVALERRRAGDSWSDAAREALRRFP